MHEAAQDFVMMREDLRVEIERTQEFLAPLANVQYPKMFMRPYPEFRAIRVKLWAEARDPFIKMHFAKEDLDNAMRELTRAERPEIERMHGYND
jgi:hypothetical protein